jgi:hypothetical protein
MRRMLLPTAWRIAGERCQRSTTDVQKPAYAGFFFFRVRLAIRREHRARAFGTPEALRIARAGAPFVSVCALPPERRRVVRLFRAVGRCERAAPRLRNVTQPLRCVLAPLRSAVHAADVLRGIQRVVPLMSASALPYRRAAAFGLGRGGVAKTRGPLHHGQSFCVVHRFSRTDPGFSDARRLPPRNAKSSRPCRRGRNAR